MVAIVSGNGVGLANSSLSWLGQGGVLGDAQQGRALDRVYVNAATGNLTIQRSDEGLAGLGPDIPVVRTYNSLGVLANDFDNQDLWLPGLYKRVTGLTGTVNTSGSTITRRDSDGTEIVYTYNTSAAAYIATDGDGAHDKLTYNTGTKIWTWTDGSLRFTETYDNAKSGRITTRKDPDLNTLTYTYNSSGYITRVASSTGESTYLDYTGSKLTQIRRVTGAVTATRVRYGYDANNRLSTVTVDLSPADNSIADAKTYVTTYTYDGTSKRVASITQSDGSRIDFAYTLVGSIYRLTEVKQDPLGLNRITGIAYNTTTRTTTITDPLGQTTVLTYDTSNLLLGAAGPAVGGVSQTVTYAYDASGNVSQVTDARGNVTVYQYDANGNRTLERDAAGNTVTRTFSATNQALTQTVYAVADPDGAGAGQPGTPSTTRYAYDAEEHLRFVVSGEGAVSESRYNTAGQVTQSIQYTGVVYNVSALLPTDTLSESTLATWIQAQDKTDTTLVAYTYDVRGQLASSTRYAKVNASGQGVLDGTQATTNYVYDPSGNLLSTVDPRGVATTGVPNDYVTSYSYDGLNRLTASTDALGAVTLIQYDNANRKTVTTAANGLISTATYDKAGELISVVKSDATPSNFGETKYFYDANARLRMVQDPTGVKTHSLYDAAGRKVADIDATGSLTEYIYNANNQIVSTIRYATGVTLSLLVDGSGNPTSVALSTIRPSTTEADRRIWAIYDTAGRVAKTIDETGAVTERLYDGRSQLTKTIAYATLVNPALISTTTVATDTAVSPSSSPNDRVTRYFYDNDGNNRGVLDAEGYLTEYRYDALGRQTETIAYATATNVSLRATGSLAALTPAGAADDIHTYRIYNASGQRVGDVDAEGYLTEHIYDLAGNQTQSIRYATKVDSNYLTARSVALTVTAKTSAGAISMVVKVDGVAVPGSPMSVMATSFAAYNFNVTLVSGQNHAVDVVFTDAGPDLSIQSISLDGQTIQATNATTTFDAGAGSAAFDGTGVIAGQQLLNQSGALRFAIYGLPRLRPVSVSADQSTTFTYAAVNHLTSQTAADGTVTQYAYDNVGNLLTKTGAYGTAEVRTLTFKYNRLGQVVGELTGEGSALLAGLVNQADIDAVWNVYGLKHAYDAAGRRTSTTDANGNRTLFYYNADGQLTHTINALGEVFESNYNALNQLSETVKYTLRLSAGSLAGLQGGAADSGFLGMIAALTSATLDAHRQLQYDLAGRIAARFDALNHSVTYGYNAFGDETSRVTQIDASNTLMQSVIYDHRSQATQTTADAAGINLVRAMQYDAFGRLTQTTDGNVNLTTQSYDRLGRVVQVKDAFNKTDTLTYDAFNRVLTQTDRLGKVTSYVYDTVNRSVVVTTPEGVTGTTVRNRHGELASQTDGKGGLTAFAYDRDGNLLSTTAPLSGTSSRYDAAGRLIEITDANGIKTAYAYDAASRLIGRTVDPDNLAISYVGLKLTTNYRYDGQGRSVWTQDPKGVWTQTEYDKEGQVTAVTLDPKRGPDWVSGPDDNPNGLAVRTTYAYDYRGKTLTVTEGAGSAQPKVTQYVYDKLGRRTQERVDPSGLNLTTTYLYDKNNNVTTKTDATGQVTRYYYDAEDRLIYTLDPLKGLIARSYDDKGQIVQVLAYAQALTGLPATPTVANIQSAIVANAATDQAQRSVYDGDGREVYTIDALGFVTKKAFDANGNVIAQTRYANAVSLGGNPTPAQVNTALTPSATLDRITKYVYDAANRLRYTVDALGFVSESRYDAAGRITQTILRATAPSLSASPTLAELDALYAAVPLGASDRDERFEYDTAGRLARSFDGEGFSEQYGYDAVGNKVSFTNKKGAVWTYVYDAARRLTSEFTPQVEVSTVAPQSGQLIAQAQTVSLETRIAYNALGSVTSRTEAYGRIEARTTSYIYDAAGRQTSTVFPQVGIYNAAGDDLTTNGINGTVSRTESATTPQNQVVYDAVGRAVVNRDVANNYSYKVYDALGQIVYEVDAEHFVSQHSYDAFGNRLSTTRYATAVTFTDGLAPLTASQVAGWLSGQSPAQHAADRLISTDFDRLNRATQVTEPAAFTYDSTAGTTATVGRTTINLYNRFGEVIKQTIGNASTYLYYDRRGAKTAQIDALGNVSILEYNAAKELTRQVEYAQALTAGSWNETTLPSPAVTTPATSPGSAIGFDREVTYQYDRKGQRVAESRIGVQYNTLGSGLTVNDASGNLTTTYGYDGVGNLTRSTDPSGVSTYTYYDALGRTIASAEPTREVNSTGGVVQIPPLRSSNHWIGFSITGSETSGFFWSGLNKVKLDWESLADYGAGSVRVVVNYVAVTGGTSSASQSFGGETAMAGVVMTWNNASGTPRGISSISRVQVYKLVNGQEVLVYDRTASGSDQRLRFQKPTLTGINVELRYKVQGTAAAPVLATLVSEGNLYTVSAASLSADVYQYEVTYRKVSDNSVVATGTGTFEVQSTTVTGSVHAASFVDQRDLTISSASANWQYASSGESGGYQWVGTNSVSLTWSALENWQGGTIRVIVDYRNKTTAGGAGSTAQITQDYDLSKVMTGTSFSWGTGAGGLYAVDRIRVQRYVGTPANATTLIDRTNSGSDAERLILQGNTAGITGINITGVGVLAATALGNGVYTVDLSGRARGTYQYTIVGNSSVGGSLEIRKGATSGSPSLLEQPSGTSWILSAYNLPADTTSAVLQYRRSGDTGPYLSKGFTKQLTNEWTASYDDLAAGSYEYQIVAQRPGGPTSYGGTLGITRGASLTTTTQSQTIAETITPLTLVNVDAFGATVQLTRLARGAASVSESAYTLLGADAAADEISLFQRDAHGHVIWTQDAEGKASYASYDVLGHSAKEWRPITDNDGRVQNAIRVFKYDKLGQQIETLEPSFRPNGSLVTSPTTQTLEDTKLSYSISSSATWFTSESGGTLIGTSSVSLTWNDMSAWGADDIQVVINYTKTHPSSSATKTFILSGSSTATGATVSWTDTDITAISSVQVYKKDASGTFRLIHNRTTSSTAPYSRLLTFTRPTNNDSVQIKYRAVGTTTWLTPTATQFFTFGNKFVFDIRAIVDGTYEYETLYTRASETTPYSRYGATIVESGLASTLTAGSAASSYQVPALSTAAFLKAQARYNAFGEITGKGINDGWQENFNYDNAGHLWRTNQGDGASKVSLYDVQGNATALIAGRTSDLSSVADAQSAYNLAIAGGANPPTAVSWTQTKYDALGRAVQQIQPSFTVSQESLVHPRSAESMVLSWSSSTGGIFGTTISFSASWNNMLPWGDGNVRIFVDYRTRTATTSESGTTYGSWVNRTGSVDLSASVGATGGSLDLARNYNETSCEILRVRVYKQDISGALQTVHDRTTSSASPYDGAMTWAAPPIASTASIQTAPAGTGSFTTQSSINFGTRFFINPSLAAGTYDYQITHSLPGGLGSSMSSGTFTIIGASLTVTNASDPPTVSTLTPTITQTVDRWGNVLSVTDPRNAAWVTSYRYNDLNEQILVTLPQVQVGFANGTTSSQSPTSSIYYDALGRRIATRDANTTAPNAVSSTFTLDAAGQLVKEMHADGAVVNTVYDIFGRKSRYVDALGNTTNYTYDRLGRMTGEQLPIGSRSYVLDEVGNRIRETNASNETIKYWYDTRGKVIQTRLPMGQESATYYDQRGNLTKSVDANGNVGTWAYDYFGRITAHTDMDAKTYGYTYDAVTRKLTRQTSTWGQYLEYDYYQDGKLRTITDTSTATTATTLYEYDEAGNRTRERYARATTPNPTVFQDTRISYDALGRMSTIVDVRDTITYSYDAVGNRRRTTSQFYDTNNLQKTVDNWYLYDAMNRITLSQGVLQGGVIQIRAYQNPGTPAQGVSLAYDGAGNRRTATFYEGTSGTAVAESYTYDANNQLTSTNRGGNLTSSRTYDPAGRVIQTIAYSSPGTVSVRRQNAYNTNGWLTQTESFDAANTLQSRVSYTAFDNGGNTKSYSVSSYVGTAYTNYYNYTYQLRDTYKESVIAGTSTYFTPGSTTSTYDANGNLTQVVDQFGTNTTRTFINSQAGQILQKTENSQTQNFFYANGNPVGSSGIVNTSGTVIVNPDFDYNYTPVNDRYPPVTPGSYVVAQGDTLQGIAFTMFGDASLWYLIADANGLRQDSDLIVGKALVIPNKITNLRNSYDVFKPYQPGEIIGDTTPTLPDPPPPPAQEGGGGGCGSLGDIVAQILVVVVQIVVTAITGSPVLGNIASQLVGMATGIREKFSWKEVAVAWLTQGADKIGTNVASAAKVTNVIGQQVVSAAVSNVVTQGISIAVGVQEKFSWTGVAAAAISAPITNKIDEKFGNGKYASTPIPLASGIAAEASKSIVRQGVSILVNGGGKMDWANVASDAFGNAIGNDLAPRFAKAGAGFREGVNNLFRPKSDIQYIEANRDDKVPVPAAPTGIDMGGAAMAALKTPDPREEVQYVAGGDYGETSDGAAGPRGVNIGQAAIDKEKQRVAFEKAINDPLARVVKDTGEVVRSPLTAEELEGLVAIQTRGKTPGQPPTGTSVDAKTGLLVDPKTGKPSFAYSSRVSRMQSDVAERAMAERENRSPSLTEWIPQPSNTEISKYRVVESAVGMAADAFGVVSGVAITGTGLGLTMAPEPTTLSKWAGVPLTAYGAAYTTKSAIGLGLNATNFVSAIRGNSSEMPGSALEWAVQASGGSPEAGRVAVAFDLGWDLLTGNVQQIPLKTGHILQPSTAALLQAPLSTNVTTEALKSYPKVWSVTTGTADTVITSSDLGYKVKDHIVDPITQRPK